MDKDEKNAYIFIQLFIGQVFNPLRLKKMGCQDDLGKCDFNQYKYYILALL